MRTRAIRAGLAAAFVTICGTGASVFAQAPAQGGNTPPATGDTQVRRLTVDDAVRLAAENNLGIQVARIDPQVEDLNIAIARTAWTPAFTTTLQQGTTNQPANSLLSGAQGSGTRTGETASNVGLQQTLPFGGSYAIGWDNTRSTSNSLFTSFSPQVSSSMSLNFSQPLLRGFKVDSTRNQLLVTQKNREIADVQLQQTLASTSRTVRNAYWELAYARASLQVAQQSLELANQQLRDTRARVEIGTTPPIDVVEAEAEVATREEAVIVAESNIDAAEDTLRALIYNPQMPDFWTVHIETADAPAVTMTTVDADGAVRNALEHRTDLAQSRKSLEANDLNIRFLHNQTLPDVTADFTYGLTGLGGTQLQRGTPEPGQIAGPVTGEINRSYASVLSDLFGNQFPRWTLQLNISYPLGQSQEEASLARARLQYSQTLTQIRSQELQVATQVRDAARQVQTNRKRIDTTRAARELNERRLEAEQRKFAAGTSTNFQIFQAQRDLAQARANELRAVLDYQRSVVDLDTVQQVPLTGGTGTSGVGAASSATSTSSTTSTSTTP